MTRRSFHRLSATAAGSLVLVGSVLGAWGFWRLGYRPPPDTPGMIVPALALFLGTGLVLVTAAAHTLMLLLVRAPSRRRYLSVYLLLFPAALGFAANYFFDVKAGGRLAYALLGVGELVVAGRYDA